jgi:branched-chain amino acid transport system permease protein
MSTLYTHTGWRSALASLLIAALVAVPMYAWFTQDMYVLTLVGRILAFGLAALAAW